MSDANPSHGSHHHRKQAPAKVPTAVITVSDTRTLETDTGGGRVVECLEGAGHPVVCREIVADEPSLIQALLARVLEQVLLAGGDNRAAGAGPQSARAEVPPLRGRQRGMTRGKCRGVIESVSHHEDLMA